MLVADLIRAASEKGQRTLSEYESKRLLAEYDIPVCREELAHFEDEVREHIIQKKCPFATDR